MSNEDEERESEELELPRSPLKVLLKWLGIISALSALVGYGIWIGTIQNTISTLKDDVSDNEIAIKGNSKLLQEAETRERDRLNELSQGVVRQFNSDKDELWELKRAMAAVNTRVAMYHDRSYQPPSMPSFGGGESATSSPPQKLSTAASRKLVAKQADTLIQDVLESDEPPPPMPTF